MSYTISQSDLNQMTPRGIGDIEFAVIHHTVMPPTADIADVAAAEAPNGWLAVGYNDYCKCVDPVKDVWIIQAGRPLDKKPAAQFGLNAQGYALAIGGNYQPGAAGFLTPVSENCLKVVAAHLMAVKKQATFMNYLIGHRDVAPIGVSLDGGTLADYSTLCPGDNLYARLHDLRLLTGLKEYDG
jgi:hypothetical protein